MTPLLKVKNVLAFLRQSFEIDSITSIRNNQETSIRHCGQHVLHLYIAKKLRILNGSPRRFLHGSITYMENTVQYSGVSVTI